MEIKIYKANDDKYVLEKNNKELIDKLNNFDGLDAMNKELEEKLKNKEDEIKELRNKITELESNLENKHESIKSLEEQLIANDELFVKKKKKHEKEMETMIECNINQKHGESPNKNSNHVNIDKYIEKAYHEEILKEKQNEIDNLLNMLNIVRGEKEELDHKISNMKNSIQEVSERLEIEIQKHNKINEEKSEMLSRYIKLICSLK